MPDFRAYWAATTSEPSEITLSADESHHLVSVNRARAGDGVVVFDGRGTEWDCELVNERRQGAALKVRARRCAEPLPYAITLGQALPKGPAMDAIVRKATEIGARRIAPLVSERTQVHFDDERSERKLEKWQSAALEAAKQCGNPFLPEIAPVASVDGFVASVRDYDLKLVASLHPGAQSLKQVLAAFRARHGREPQRAAWLIGPEGDFTPAEISLVQEAGFEPVTFGPLVLRCETAAAYALSILSYELQAAAGA